MAFPLSRRAFAHRLSAALVLGLAALLLVGCGDDAPPPEAPLPTQNRRTVQVQVLEADTTAFDDRIQLTGTVEAIDDVNLSAEVAGQLSYVAPLGTRVGRGTVVARTDQRLLQSAVEAAQAQFDLAEDTFNRQQALYRDSVISALEFATYRAQRNQARAQLDQANKQLEDTRMRSPITGRIEERFVEAGELVAPGTPVVRIVDTRRVKVKTGIPERYAGDVEIGTPVSARFDAYGQGTREGDVSFVGNVIAPNSRTFVAEVEFDNREGALKPEMVSDLSILRRRLEDVIVVPQNALVRDEDGTSLYIVVDAGDALMAERRAVEVGPSFGGRVVIAAGLEGGERVIVVGQNRIAEGDRVEIDRTFESVEAYMETSLD